MVQRLLEIKSKADQAVCEAFIVPAQPIISSSSLPKAVRSRSGENDEDASTSALPSMVPDTKFLYALTDAFTSGFKARKNKPAEAIAKHLDRVMRHGQGTQSDAEFQDVLDHILELCRFSDDKDVFRTFYVRQLAKRLLLEKSASTDFEKKMLQRLKDSE